ncbi:hydrolase [Marmoricola endophyticus]|uniref:Hydrolase n=1 Tax=Marmoricola endophyticus TaxID=2040280 RepID=A0A917BJ34_9ACTN|nr:HAD family hydrolase [Marmoricola endophyticus]GGF48006.1 hydrolase [Marmoricola endophyticus]
MIRLLATDLDGTLLGSDGALSARTSDALAAADAAGLTVVFVTGRPIRWAEEVFEHVGPHGVAIVSNGAVVYDVAAGAVRATRAIDPVVGLEVVSLIRAAVPGTGFAVEQVGGISFEADFLHDHPVPDGARSGTVEEIFDGPAVKLLARHESVDAQEFWRRAEDAVGDRVVVTWSSSTALLEISAAGVTKATTLAQLCESLGLAREEVAAIGDMPNDIAMLQWAGTSYAMGNAHDSVRAVADHLAPTNDEDGVAQVVEGLLAAR